MKKIVFIIGRGHSGSTLLSLILGSHSNMLSLGEITDTFETATLTKDEHRERLCSCGAAAARCDLWSQVRQRVDSNEDDLLEFYRNVTDRVDSLYGGRLIPVDSSKEMNTLRLLNESPEFDVRAIFLVKDVRNYAISRIDQHRGNAFKLFSKWQKKNQAMRQALDRDAISYFLLGYEELCLNTNEVMSEVCEFLGVDMEDSMLDLVAGTHHVLRGNRMVHDQEKNRAIKYDARWFKRSEWQLPALLLPKVMRLNNQLVYSNR